MSDIRINSLPPEPNPSATDNLAIDGATTRRATAQAIVNAGAPVASQAEAQAGTDAVKRMTPLTTKQSIASEVGVTLASAAQGSLAGTALQPSDIGTTIDTVAAGDDSRIVGAAQRAALPFKYFDFVGTPSPTETREYLQSLVNSGGAVYLPAGDMFIDDEILLPQLPIALRGNGQQASRIIQNTAGKDAIRFQATGSNTIPSNGTIYKSVEIHDLSILRNGTNGGRGISASWIAETNNQSLFTCNNVQVYNWNDGYKNWTTGIYLFNCFGSRITNSFVRGNPNETAIDAVQPYSMDAAIEYTGTGADAFGMINHFRANNTLMCAHYGVKVSDWYEGMYSVNEEIVQVNTGVYIVGDAVKQNPNIFFLNTHMDYRYRGFDVTNVLKISAIQCDLFKDGKATATGYSGDAVALVNCIHAKFVGNTISTKDTTKQVGFNVSSGCFRPILVANNLQLCSNGVNISAGSSGAMIDANVFYQNDNGNVVLSAGNSIGINHFDSCTTDQIIVAGNKYAITATS